jgi:hypothetical protein
MRKRTRKQLKENNEAQKLRNQNNKQRLEDLVNYSKILEDENAALKSRLLAATTEIGKLNVELLHLQKENELLKSQQENYQIFQTITSNTKDLIESLPFNSPYRRPLLFWFFKKLSFEDGGLIYNISRRTWLRIIEGKDQEIVSRKYAIGVKREKITPERIDEAKKILDDIIPVQSGRDYRYQEVTDKKLYEVYCGSTDHALSKSFFLYSIVSQEKIRHSKSRKFCPLCEKFENGDKSDELKQHQKLIPIQRGEYHTQKKNIEDGITPTTALITQDFTQLEFAGGFVQDLIICIYTKDKEKIGLNRVYRHFIGNSGDKILHLFVAGKHYLKKIFSNILLLFLFGQMEGQNISKSVQI